MEDFKSVRLCFFLSLPLLCRKLCVLSTEGTHSKLYTKAERQGRAGAQAQQFVERGKFGGVESRQV